MANEKRLDLIDRKALIKAVEKKQFAIADNTHPYEAIRIQGKYFREIVDNAPTVDAVEVVRCKDCKWLYELSAIDRRFYCRHHPQGLSGINIVEENPFCSYGERRTDV